MLEMPRTAPPARAALVSPVLDRRPARPSGARRTQKAPEIASRRGSAGPGPDTLTGEMVGPTEGVYDAVNPPPEFPGPSPLRAGVTRLVLRPQAGTQESVTLDALDHRQSEAVDRLRRARDKLERVSRETDWRRSRYTPGQVLSPLHRAVREAEEVCRRLGLRDELLRQA